MTRGLRNMNPGNIRETKLEFLGEVDGVDKAFETFKSMPYGYRAIFVILYTYYKRYNLKTIKELIDRWAPLVENNTVAYINTVCKISGLSANDVVDFDNPLHMIKIVAAVSYQENGVKAVTADVQQGWNLYKAFRGMK